MAPSIDLTDIVTSGNAAAAIGSFKSAQSLLGRALKQDPAAVVRVRQAGERSIDLFVSTPLKCAASVRVPGRVEGSDVFMAEQALNALAGYEPGQQSLEFGPTMGIRWPGALPPVDGYALVDTVPAENFRSLHADMEKENASTPNGIARSLLDQTLVTISSDEEPSNSVEVTGRIVAAIGGLGVAAKPKNADLKQYDQVRVSANSSWIRLDTLFATIFTPRPGGLSRVP